MVASRKPRPPPTSGERFDAGEVESSGDGFAFERTERRHRLVEHRRFLQVLGVPVEQVRAEEVIEGRLAGAHAVERVAPRRPGRCVAYETRETIHRARHATAQQLADRRERERAPRAFVEHPEIRERPHQAVGRVFVRSTLARDFCARPRSCAQAIGDAELGGSVYRLRRPLADDELLELQVGGSSPGIPNQFAFDIRRSFSVGGIRAPCRSTGLPTLTRTCTERRRRAPCAWITPRTGRRSGHCDALLAEGRLEGASRDCPAGMGGRTLRGDSDTGVRLSAEATSLPEGTVTVLSTDLVGSTALNQRLGDVAATASNASSSRWPESRWRSSAACS